MSNAVQLHQSGDLVKAETAYRSISRQYPKFTPARHFLGVVLSQSKRHDEAIEILNAVIVESPDDPVARHNLALALFNTSAIDKAIEQYQIALKLKPDFADAHFNLGNALKHKNRYDTAVNCYRQALSFKPQFPTALNNLANTLLILERFDEALNMIDQALALKPDYSDAYLNRGNILTKLKRYDDAIADYQSVLQFDPELIEAQLNWAKTLNKANRQEEAIELFEQILAQEPDNHAAHNSLGCCWMDMNDLQRASNSLKRAIEIAPDSADAHFNYSLALLKSGSFTNGWEEHEWRMKGDLGKSHYPYKQPRWQGESFDGKTLMIYAEQGFGDSIQFVRFFPEVKKRGGKVIFLCQPELISLFAEAEGIDEFIPRPLKGVPDIEFDYFAALMSLPHILGLDNSDQFSAAPYLSVGNQQAAKWREQIHDDGHLNIGIVWAGNPRHSNDANRSIPFEQFERLAKITGVSLYGLQVDPGIDQVQNSSAQIIEAHRCTISTTQLLRYPALIWLSRSIPRQLTWRVQWASQSGSCCPSHPTGAGCWKVKLVPGIRVCDCSASLSPGNGRVHL